MTYGKAVAAVLLMAASCAATAQVYKCSQPDGRMAYQDHACASGAGKPIDARPAAGSSRTATTGASAAASTTSKEKALLDQYERERQLRAITYDIDQLERAMDSDQQRMDAELDALRNRKRYANNNLAGATWEASISQEMQAVTERYNTKAAADRQRLEDMRKRRDSLEQ